jgi:hypothetical protein
MTYADAGQTIFWPPIGQTPAPFYDDAQRLYVFRRATWAVADAGAWPEIFSFGVADGGFAGWDCTFHTTQSAATACQFMVMFDGGFAGANPRSEVTNTLAIVFKTGAAPDNLRSFDGGIVTVGNNTWVGPTTTYGPDTLLTWRMYGSAVCGTPSGTLGVQMRTTGTTAQGASKQCGLLRGSFCTYFSTR